MFSLHNYLTHMSYNFINILHWPFTFNIMHVVILNNNLCSRERITWRFTRPSIGRGRRSRRWSAGVQAWRSLRRRRPPWSPLAWPQTQTWPQTARQSLKLPVINGDTDPNQDQITRNIGSLFPILYQVLEKLNYEDSIKWGVSLNIYIDLAITHNPVSAKNNNSISFWEKFQHFYWISTFLRELHILP